MKQFLFFLGLMVLTGISITAQAEAFPVFSYNQVIGGVDNKGFMDAKQAGERFSASLPYKEYLLYHADGVISSPVVLEAIEKTFDEFYGRTVYTVKSNNVDYFSLALPKNLSWKPQPQTIKKLSQTEVDACKPAIRRLLDENHMENSPVVIRQAYQTDINGDGLLDIILLALESKNSPVKASDYEQYRYKYADFGDYGLLAMIDGQTPSQASLIIGEFYNHHTENISRYDLPKYRLDTIADINGDGVMEVMMTREYFESSITAIYDLSGQTPKRVICDAEYCD